MENNHSESKLSLHYFDLIQNILLSLLFFILPIKVKLATGIFMLVILSFILKLIFEKQKPNLSYRAFKKHYGIFHWILVSMAIFELLHLLGMLYTSNVAFGWFDVTAKLLFFIVPLFLFFNLLKLNLWFIYTFLFGCCFVVLLNSTIYFFPDFFNVKAENALVFSKFMHRSYFSIFILFGLSFLFFQANLPKWMFFVFFPIFSFGVVFSLSKAAILTFILLNIIGLIYLIYHKKWGFILYFMTIGLFGYLTPFQSQNDILKQRFKNVTDKNFTSDKNSTESNAARKFTWHASLELIKAHPLIGVGTGDIKDELNKKQYELGYHGIAKQKLNAHNQFLNTWIAIGLPGLIVLLFITIGGVIVTLRHKNWLAFSFFSILSFNALFESIFETEAGIFALCFGVIIFTNEKFQNEIK